MFKKFFAALTAMVMVLAISSCGGNEKAQVPEASAAETSAEGKKTIKLTLLGGLDTNLELRIADFNKTSEGYEIEVEDRPSSDLAKAIDALNLEIIAGSAPDIVDGFFLPIESYAEKGLLANYYDFIDSDPEMCREDFLENIFKACEINGGLYENITSFSLHVLIDKKSVADEMRGRTANDFIDLAEKYPDKNLFNAQRHKYGIFDGLTRFGWKSFADKETGRCDFDSERFIRILEFCNTYPDTASDSVSDNILFNTEYSSVSNFYDLRKAEYALGETAAAVGFPDTEGNGALIRTDGSFIVFENSPVKEGVWEFLRTDYLDEYQNLIVTDDEYHTGGSRFPVKKTALEFAAAEAEKSCPPSYPGENTDIYGINSDEDNQRIIDLINGASVRFTASEDFVYDVIILEEVDMYFSGQRPAKDTAEIIQNRVQNYLDENR